MQTGQICKKIRDGKEREPSKNEPNHNPSFAKNRTELELELELESKNVQKSEPNRTLSLKNRTEPEPKCHRRYSVISLNKIVGTFTHFTVNEAFYFT